VRLLSQNSEFERCFLVRLAPFLRPGRDFGSRRGGWRSRAARSAGAQRLALDGRPPRREARRAGRLEDTL